MKAEILSQIRNVTSSLIGMNLSEDQTFPSEKDGIIYISGAHDLSIALKNVSYSKIYEILNAEKNFNIRMVDGALIQIMYIFNNEDLVKYRLAFFPSPNLEKYQNDPELYDEDSIFANIISKNIVPTPIRFDYDKHAFVDTIHPLSHLTIGQYKNCRIPLSKIITPNLFIDFILRNFYNTVRIRFSDQIKYSTPINLTKTITDNERNILHLNTELING